MNTDRPDALHRGRRAAAEAVGTGILVSTVIGSGIAAQRLSPGDVGLQLLENTIATVAVLFVLIRVLAPISGAHLNPVISLVDHFLRRRTGSGLGVNDTIAYIAAQIVGGIGGAFLAQAMFEATPAWSTTERGGTGQWLGEIVATAGLVGIVVLLGRNGSHTHIPAVVAGWIGAAYWATSSTSFANPAVTIGRTLSDTFAGIAPASAPGFLIAQTLGALVGLVTTLTFVPSTPARQSERAN